MPKSINRTSTALLAITFLSIMPVNTRTVRAQEQSAFPFQYAVAFVCGRPIDPKQFQRTAQTTYFTSINIHNSLVGNVSFRKKVALRAGSFFGVSNIKPFTDSQLPGDGALIFNCRDISFDVFQGDLWVLRPFLEGFVVIESRVELDVVVIYTTENSGSRTQDQTVAISVERVPVRRLALPDLVPIPDAKGNFCRRDENGRLVITVHNHGLADAGASITRVEFATGGHQLITTPAIPAGGSVDVFVTFPPLCFRPDCTFRIAVDSTGFVSESDEFNNAAGGTCKG